jgi:hypothetical protein
VPSARDPSASDVTHGPARRYTVRLELWPDRRSAEYAVVTAMGELKAVAMATVRAIRQHPDAGVLSVEITRVEKEFTIDPARDLLDDWESS